MLILSFDNEFLIFSISIFFSGLISIVVPPLKSTPKSNPFVNTRIIEAKIKINDSDKKKFLYFKKLKLVILNIYNFKFISHKIF